MPDPGFGWQLVNWLCCATVYVEQTGDREWLEKRWPIFEKCFDSMVNRDHPEPQKRRGLMQPQRLATPADKGESKR